MCTFVIISPSTIIFENFRRAPPPSKSAKEYTGITQKSNHKELIFNHFKCKPCGGGGTDQSFVFPLQLVKEVDVRCISHHFHAVESLVMFNSEDPWHSHFMPSVWQWSSHFLGLYWPGIEPRSPACERSSYQ